MSNLLQINSSSCSRIGTLCDHYQINRSGSIAQNRTKRNGKQNSLLWSAAVFVIAAAAVLFVPQVCGDIEPHLDVQQPQLLQQQQPAYDDSNVVQAPAVVAAVASVSVTQQSLQDSKNVVTSSNSASGGSGSSTSTDNKPSFATDPGFIHAFLASLSVILVSELGDKTFFIAAIMAMRHARLVVFAGAIGALGLMTVLSAVFGMAATIIPRVYTYYISTALFAIFGLKMLKDGYYMSPTDAQEEFEEVQSDLKKREDELIKKSLNENSSTVTVEPLTEQNDADEPSIASTAVGAQSRLLRPVGRHQHHQSATSLGGGGGAGSNSSGNNNNADSSSHHQSLSDINAIELKQLNNKRFEKETSSQLIIQDPESGSTTVRKSTKTKGMGYLTSRVLMQAFTMTFLAEWGDRSQLTTIILSAREDVYGVIVGGVLGHSLCTGLAVIGGRMIAQRISVRTVTLVGGVVFLLFAFSALFFSPHEETPTVNP